MFYKWHRQRKRKKQTKYYLLRSWLVFTTIQHTSMWSNSNTNVMICKTNRQNGKYNEDYTLYSSDNVNETEQRRLRFMTCIAVQDTLLCNFNEHYTVKNTLHSSEKMCTTLFIAVMVCQTHLRAVTLCALQNRTVLEHTSQFCCKCALLSYR